MNNTNLILLDACCWYGALRKVNNFMELHYSACIRVALIRHHFKTTYICVQSRKCILILKLQLQYVTITLIFITHGTACKMLTVFTPSASQALFI